MLITYDPKTRKFTEPVRIGPQSSDHHYSPIIWADEADYLHVLHGCHRTPGTHLISAEPVVAGTSKVKWKEAPKIAKRFLTQRSTESTMTRKLFLTEPMATPARGPIESVMTMVRPGLALKMMTSISTAKGRTDWSSYRTALPSKDGRYLHMVYVDYDDYIKDLTPDRLYNPRYKQIVSNDWKYNLSYVKIDLKSYEVSNSDGKVLRTPIDIDYSKENCQIWDTEGRGAGIPPHCPG